ncbi:DUF5671 domain-containing protein [Microbacterium invictum]|uniref:DUF5671 domain-containing protein n=1 Tax=Microbacterium invictum TaxID=515415 RepID=A0AA40SLG2_9MICO|nr:DUF5671 domain-containing protein [Microbacterium invictum]MBB4138413.1 hypothetical protein [Microbacterium invictum]
MSAATPDSAAVGTPASTPQRGAQGTVRRVIVFILLFVLVTIAAMGVSGLLGRLFETRPEFDFGIGGLALSLAFTLVGGPLALVLWWFTWRRLDGPDRSSVAWGLYLAAISFVALVTFATSLLGMFSDLIGGRWSPDSLGTGIAWLAVWIAHRWMWAHPRKSPLRLTTVPIVLGAAYGLGVVVSGAIRTLASLFDEAIIPAQVQLGDPWWTTALQGLVWFAGGALVWWWHWMRDRARGFTGGFADVMLVLTGVLGAGAVTLGGVGTAVYIGLRAAFDRTDPWPELLDLLGLAIAAAGVGAIAWLYHRRVARERSELTRSATRLVEAGLGLIAAASGIGVIVNALLAALTAPLAGSDARTLLLAGIAALVVGAPVWWVAWRPLEPVMDAGAVARRVFLVAVFGVSAVVAIIALLVVGYRVFEFSLDGGGTALIERIRAPFGLLLATALVAGYHFAVWRRDRAAAPAVAHVRTIDRVVLVASGDAGALAAAIEAATGASVARWARADAADSAISVDAVVAALSGVSAHRVLVLTGPADRVEVVPLAD